MVIERCDSKAYQYLKVHSENQKRGQLWFNTPWQNEDNKTAHGAAEKVTLDSVWKLPNTVPGMERASLFILQSDLSATFGFMALQLIFNQNVTFPGQAR